MSKQAVIAEGTSTIAVESWPTVDDFYRERGGKFSGEADYGVWWEHNGRRWRISVVDDTGDVYAVCRDAVFLLGTFPHEVTVRDHRCSFTARGEGSIYPEGSAYAAMDKLADDDWDKACVNSGSLVYAAQRIKAATS